MNYRKLFASYRSSTHQLISLVLPILAAHQIGALLPFVNTTLAGRHDPLWLAAIGLANTAFTTVMGFGWGIITSVGILTANELGKSHNPNKNGIILKASLLTSIIISLPIMVLLRYIQPVLLFFGQSPEIASISQEYLNGLLWMVFVDFGRFSIFQFAIAYQRVAAPLIATAVSIPLVLILNTLLIPYSGVYGIGFGTAIAYWVVFIGLWAYCYKDRVFSACLLASASFKTYLTMAIRQFELGIPIGAMSTIELLFIVIIGLWVGQISTDHLIAHQISMQWLCFAIMIAVSFSEAITIAVAKCLNRPLIEMIQFLTIGIYLSAICTTLISCIYWVFPHSLIRLDLGAHSNNPELVAITTVTLALCGIFQIFDAIRIALSGVLRGLSDTQYPMWITLFTFWGIGLPVAYISTFIFNWQQTGLWFGMTCAVITMIGLQYVRMRTLLKAANNYDN